MNDILVRFMIDRGASERFISETLVEDNDLLWCKNQESLRKA